MLTFQDSPFHLLDIWEVSSMSTNMVPVRGNASEVEGVNASNGRHHHKCPSTTESYKILKSIMFTFILMGNMGWKDSHKTGCWAYITKSSVYGGVVVIFLSTNVIRWCLMLNNGDMFNIQLIFKLIVVTWGLETLCHVIGFFVASLSYKRLPEFLFEWNELRCLYVQSTTSLKKQTNICTGVIWMLTSLNTAFNSYLVFCTHVEDIILYPLTIEDEHFRVLLMKIISLVAHTYLTFAWIAPSAFLFLISNILAWEFNYNTEQIRALRQHFATDCLRRIRKNHQRLCNLVDHANDIFSVQIAATFLGSLMLICLILYEMIRGDDVIVLLRCIQMYWLTIAGCKILIDCISGARLNQAVRTEYISAHAHTPARTIMTLDFKSYI